MAESIKVVCRFRGGQETGSEWILDPDQKSLQAPSLYSTSLNAENKFRLDCVCDSIIDQSQLYQVAAKDTVKALMNGYNGTIFAYGQSGSGKTYTMLGPDEVVDVIVKGIQEVPTDLQKKYGIIPRAVFQIFQEINRLIEIQDFTFEIRVSYFEIYQEEVNDLLGKGRPESFKLKIRQDKDGSFQVQNAKTFQVTTPDEIFDLLMIGQQQRVVASTNQNERSSRSHTLFVLEYFQSNPDGSCKQGRLNLVDLAGSERIGKTGATGQTLLEAKHINLSLSELGQVILKITEGNQFVNFRNSKLTQLLKESLGGNSKTALICTLSKQLVHLEESISTLQFAQRAKKIKNKAIVNETRSPKEMEILINKLKQENQGLKTLLQTNNINPSKALNSVPRPQSAFLSQSNGKDTKQSAQRQQQEINDLTMRLTEVETAYEHYKQKTEDEQIEMREKLLKAQQQNTQSEGQSQSNDMLQNDIFNLKFQLQDQTLQHEKSAKNQDLKIGQLEYQLSQLKKDLIKKDFVIAGLRKQNESLQGRLDRESFEIYNSVKKDIFDEMANVKATGVESYQRMLLSYELKIANLKDQSNQINKLTESNRILQLQLSQFDPSYLSQPQQQQSQSSTSINSTTYTPSSATSSFISPTKPQTKQWYTAPVISIQHASEQLNNQTICKQADQLQQVRVDNLKLAWVNQNLVKHYLQQTHLFERNVSTRDTAVRESDELCERLRQENEDYKNQNVYLDSQLKESKAGLKKQTEEAEQNLSKMIILEGETNQLQQNLEEKNDKLQEQDKLICKLRQELNEIKLTQSQTIANAVSNMYDRRIERTGYAGFRQRLMQGTQITSKVNLESSRMSESNFAWYSNQNPGQMNPVAGSSRTGAIALYQSGIQSEGQATLAQGNNNNPNVVGMVKGKEVKSLSINLNSGAVTPAVGNSLNSSVLKGNNGASTPTQRNSDKKVRNSLIAHPNLKVNLSGSMTPSASQGMNPVNLLPRTSSASLVSGTSASNAYNATGGTVQKKKYRKSILKTDLTLIASAHAHVQKSENIEEAMAEIRELERDMASDRSNSHESRK